MIEYPLKISFEPPLIRFDNMKWLELLKDGSFFTRPFLYYQVLEGEDRVRKDVFDGSIPFPDVNDVIESISGIQTNNQRLVVMHRFIKSFFRCNPSNFTVTPSGLLKLSFCKEIADEIKRFNVNSAMIIASPSQFVRQIQNEANKRKEKIWYGDVRYYCKNDYNQAIASFFEGRGCYEKIPFIKSVDYSLQQEYRVCIQHRYDGISEDMLWANIGKRVINQKYTIDIGPVEDAYIMSVDNLLKNGLLIDKEGDYYLCEE